MRLGPSNRPTALMAQKKKADFFPVLLLRRRFRSHRRVHHDQMAGGITIDRTSCVSGQRDARSGRHLEKAAFGKCPPPSSRPPARHFAETAPVEESCERPTDLFRQ